MGTLVFGAGFRVSGSGFRSDKFTGRAIGWARF